MPPNITLRPIAEHDFALLREIYAATREDLALVPWDDAAKDAFLQQQFDAQHTYYQKQFPQAAFDLILWHNEPVGRLYVDRTEEELRIIDIALLRDHRGQGIGGAIMSELLREAAKAGQVVRIHALQSNRAGHIYERLAFAKIAYTGVYDLMEWRAEEQAVPQG